MVKQTIKGKNGGARPGAGRPKSALMIRTAALAAQYMEEGVTPLDILMGDMRFYHGLATTELQKIQGVQFLTEEQERIFKAAHAYKSTAREYARDAAPYIHPKLASVESKIQVSNVEAELSELE